MTKILGIDYGLERTGLAITDPDGIMAFPLKTLRLSDFKSRAELLDAIAACALKENAEIIVIGLPAFADGEENLTCRQIRNIAKRLRNRIDLPIFFEPEFLSSQQALADLRMAGRRNAKEVLDQQAACVILESFLSAQTSQKIQREE